jgi:transcriptional regulator with XRE-family HTH domain
VIVGPATTGIPDLDRAIGGLYWGDNVVFELRDGVEKEPLYAPLTHAVAQADAIVYVSLVATPEELQERYGDIQSIDARAGTPTGRPGGLLTAVRTVGLKHSRTVLLFDSLDEMVDRWGGELARRFFAGCCPMLLDIGAIAYWSVSGNADLAQLRSVVEQITQCVIVVEEHRIRIIKADGRPPGVEGSVYQYERAAGEPHFRIAPATSRLAAALRDVRLARGLTQTELARIADVSPSAISHAERGSSGLSLDTVVDLAMKLNVTLDELLRGADGPGYRLARRLDPRERGESGAVLPLLDDASVGLRVYLVRLDRRDEAAPPVTHKGVEAVAVADGLIQVELGSRTAALRAGEALVAERAPITRWRNLGESTATLFWILRD